LEGESLKAEAPSDKDGFHGILIGINPVREALIAGQRPIRRVVLQDGVEGRASVREILGLARKAGVRVDRLGKRAFQSKFPFKAAQGVAADILPKKPLVLEELLEIPGKRKEPALFVLLDGVEDPRNLGAIVRTAEASGVHGMLIPLRRSAPMGTTVAKTSAGALEFVDFSQVVNLRNSADRLRERGITLVGAQAGSPRMAWQADFTGPVAIVLGGESQGLRPIISRTCDLVVSLPRLGSVNSLNVAVAAGMLLYEVRRQRDRSTDSV